MKVLIKDLKIIYEEEIRKNVKNKKKIFEFEKQKIEYLIDIKRVLENNLYDGGKYNIFLVFKPKIRVVMSQSIYDKIINHYVARFILMPKLTKYLFENDMIEFSQVFSSIENYKHSYPFANKNAVTNIFNRYW